MQNHQIFTHIKCLTHLLLLLRDIETNRGSTPTSLLKHHPTEHIIRARTYFYHKTTQRKYAYIHLKTESLLHLQLQQNIPPPKLQTQTTQYSIYLPHLVIYALITTQWSTPKICENNISTKNSYRMTILLHKFSFIHIQPRPPHIFKKFNTTHVDITILPHTMYENLYKVIHNSSPNNNKAL